MRKRLIVIKLPAQILRSEFYVDDEEPDAVAIEDADQIARLLGGSLAYEVMEQRFNDPVVADTSEVEKLRSVVKRLLEAGSDIGEDLRKEAGQLIEVITIDDDDGFSSEPNIRFATEPEPFPAMAHCNMCGEDYPTDVAHDCSSIGKVE